ncbi:MAG: PD40 domain-containing protein [Acidobacteria bacterium]|nr:PD40 domain-containing protein [Acidobacteriota bacterium]
MTSERYQRICQLFDEALELAPEYRAAFLDQACGADLELRAEVEKFLAGMEPAKDYLARRAMDVAAEILAQQQQTPSALGKQISHYQILSLLGAGGMGRVYLARDTRLQRNVALKLLPTQYTQDAERVSRFKTEAQAASALNHPNLLTIYDVGEAAGTHFIATEYVEGQTLRQLLQPGPLPPTQVAEIALQMADALSAAHTAGIIHRDIKPENVMIRPDGYVKVLDFGLAKLTETSHPPVALHTPQFTEPGKVMGTISYMSPEQALGQIVDQRTDIFSLGVVLYELLAGMQPFKGDSEAATYNAILNLAPPSLTKTITHLPSEFAAIIERMLEKDRDLRYQTAADLRAALKRLQRDSASHDRAVAVPKANAARRRLLLSSAALLLLVIGGAWWWRTNRPAAEANRTTVTVLPRDISFTPQTDLAGTEYFPTLSPDGQTLIYASQEAGNWDLWQQTIGQRERVNLTKDAPGDDTQPAFAPDGKQVAFRSSREGGGLFVLELASRAVRKVSHEGFNPTWSADGAEIAYGTVSITTVEGRANSQLWAVRVASGEKRLVTGQDAAQPAWSPAGKRIAFWSDRADLWTIAASGGAPVRVTNDPAIDWNPCWSADGKYLYFISDRSGSMNLWRVALDENSGNVLGAPEPATTPATDMLHLSIARDGRHLAYVQRTKQRRLQSLAFDPVSTTLRGTPVFITHGTGFATHPSVSPDGQWLAYSSSGSPQEDIYIIRTDGTGLRQLTNDVAKDRVPRWSPDGKRIAFFSDRDGKNEIWAVAPTGNGALEQLTFVRTGRAVFPTWSPNGHTLAYYFYGQGSFLFDVRQQWEQQTPQPISIAGTLEVGLGVWDWSPDGKKLACLKFRSGTQASSVVVYLLASPDAAPQLTIIAENADYPVWLNDSQRLLFTRAGKIYGADLQRKTTHEVFAPAAGNAAEYCALAPDNRTIYYSLASTEADIWLATLTASPKP